MAVEMIVRKMGNSLGGTFPKGLVEDMKLKAGEKVMVQVMKVADLRDVFGSMRFKKGAQQLKDGSRKGWT